MDAGKKFIIVNTSFKFLIDDLFNDHVMFEKFPVETIKGILQTNRFIRKLFIDMVQKKFIEILDYDPQISFFTLLQYWIKSNEDYNKFSNKVKNKYLSRDVHHILERITLKGSFDYFKHCLCGIEKSMQTKNDWIKSKCRSNLLSLNYVGYGYYGKKYYLLRKFRRNLKRANRNIKSKEKCKKIIRDLNTILFKEN